MTDTCLSQAVILAAGRGTRMGIDHPKCLQVVGGKPIIEWTLGALHDAGIDDVLIVAGFRSDLLASMIDRRCEIRVNERWSESNMVRSLQCADDWLARSSTLVLYGDGAYGHRAIAHVINAVDDSQIALPIDRAWLDLWRMRFDNPLVDAETLTTRNGRIASIGSRATTLAEIEGQFMGLLALRPSGWDTIATHLRHTDREDGAAAVDRMDCTTLLSRLIARSVAIDCIDVDGGWCEFDSRSDCVAVERALDRPGFRHDFRS